jgi:hypothetical protein
MTIVNDWQDDLPPIVHTFALPDSDHELEPGEHLCTVDTDIDPDDVEVVYHESVLGESGAWRCVHCGEVTEPSDQGAP